MPNAFLAKCPPHLDACIFVNSGSEANDVAWRIAQFATGHKGGVVMAHAYHGITDAVSALTPSTGQPRDPRVVTLPPPPANLSAGDSMTPAELAAAAAEADLTIETLRERGLGPAAFYIDSSMTSSGVFDPPAAWGSPRGGTDSRGRRLGGGRRSAVWIRAIGIALLGIRTARQSRRIW